MSEDVSENLNENSGQNPDNNEEIGPFRSLAQSIIKKESSIDLGSIMQMATSLLNNNSLMDSVAELGKKTENPSPTVPEVSESAELASLSEKLEKLTNDLCELKQKSSELASLAIKLDKLTNVISELKKELRNIEKQNEYITKYVKRIPGFSFRRENS